jgi:beta-phosphoglucomutase-like phosphatase (HAD superfamily)
VTVQFVVAAEHHRLHQEVANWLALHAQTPWTTAWKVADRVVAEKTDPVVYLTAAQLVGYRDGASEYVKTS